MPKLPRPTGAELIRFLEKQGFVTQRQQGSHVRLAHPDGRKATVPVHAGRELPVGLLRAIIREDLGWSRDEFIDAWARA